MDYNYTIPCLYCDSPTPRHSAKQHTCPACWKTHTTAFGPNWFEAEWHRALLPDYTEFVRDSKLLNQSLSIERDQPSISAEDVRESVVVPPVRHHGVYEAVATLYVTQGLGTRRIKRQLDKDGVQPPVSLRTVQNYLLLVKRALAIAAAEE